MIALIQKDITFFKKFENGWPIHDITRTYLSNEQTRWRADLKAELVACEEEKAALDEERATSAKPVKKKRSIFGKLPYDDDDLSGTDGEHPSKPQVIILYLNIQPLCQTDRYPPLQLRKLLRFDDSDMEIDEEPEIKKSHVKPGTKTPNPKSVSQKKTPTKNLPSDDDYDYNTDSCTSENEKDLHKPMKGSTQKEKNTKTAMPPKGQKKVTDPGALFDSKNVTANKGKENQTPKTTKPEAKAEAPLSPPLRRDSVLRLAWKRRWPEAIDWNDVRDRTFKMKDSIVDFFHNSTKLDASPVWDQFLLSINYKLLDFSESKKKSAFPAAFRAKRCGYYGPQGEFVIYSSLLRLVSELEQDQEKLEQDLFLTLHSVITQGNNHEQFDYDELASSNYLSLDDFIRFFLVPAVATFLILEDYPGFDDSHDALFKRSNSDEYSQLFFPEDITEPTVHDIHYQNVLAIKSAQDTEPDPSPPPRHRKSVDLKPEIKTEVLKIRIHPPAVVEEEEITIGDFSPATKKTEKVRPKPTPKIRSQNSNVKAPTVNHSSYGTRSRSKAKEERIE
ncbi:hypothetical protein B0H13DRAFT_1924308 [Mycena leptocephala]|nr:hypothetical protein B0H13DRAFT_1924308 [Mycena leptocephala]